MFPGACGQWAARFASSENRPKSDDSNTGRWTFGPGDGVFFEGWPRMTLREIWTGTSNWLRSWRYEPAGSCEPVLDSNGLLAVSLESQEGFERIGSARTPRGPVAVNAVTTLDRREPAEKLQEGFNRLIDQLQQINEHLSEQLTQHQELMGRVRLLPQLLESLPSAVENQKHLTTRLLDQLRASAAKDQQFIEAVGKIPGETARQTDALTTINHQLEAAADADVQLAGNFVKFRDTLDRLNHSTAKNTEGIVQMSKTFAASDRYLKYVVTKLNKRYAWVLAIAMTVCGAAVCTLAGIILYLAR
jgi:ABC-type transporter Mla subunit MlaD